MHRPNSQSFNVGNSSNDEIKRRLIHSCGYDFQKHESYLSLIGISMQERLSKKPNIRIIQLNLFRKIGGIFSDQKNTP